MKKIKEIAAYLFIALCIFIIGANLYGKYTCGIPNVCGYKLGFIPTESMYPVIKPCSFVLASVKTDDLKAGDIVTYIKNNEDGSKIALTHRIIDTVDDKYILKGDNNKEPDTGLVDKEQILYRVVLY